MSEGFLSNAKKFTDDLDVHIRRLLAREENLREASTDLKQDARRLARSLSLKNHTHAHKVAVRAVKLGRQCYRRRDYKNAEKHFREAVFEDPQYALALTCLGNTLYKLGRLGDAATMWCNAVNADPGSDPAVKALKGIQHLRKHGIDRARGDTIA